MDKREFWTTKSKRPEFHAITFEHPAFEQPIRLVANQFAEVVLAGHLHTPAPMQIKPPAVGGETNVRMTLSFPRHVVGKQFKDGLRLVAAGLAPEPIQAVYAVYLGDTDRPEITWPLFVGDVTFSPEAVQVTLTDTNPMRRQAGEVYTPDVFTGLDSV